MASQKKAVKKAAPKKTASKTAKEKIAKKKIIAKPKAKNSYPPRKSSLVLLDKILTFTSEKNKIFLSIQKEKEKKPIEKFCLLTSRKGYFDHGSLHILEAFDIHDGILLFYFTQKPFCLGAALFAKEFPAQLIWRAANPIWGTKLSVKLFHLSYEKNIVTLSLQLGKVRQELKFSIDYLLGKPLQTFVMLQRYMNNPILTPIAEHRWECSSTFNTAAIYLDNKVHLVYRAIGAAGMSVLGYASSKNAVHVDERLPDPIYVPREPFEIRQDDVVPVSFPYMSGGGWGGCEDPRLTKIDDTLYMTYTAWNGEKPPAVALTSIKEKDFLAKNWCWKKPILISTRGEINKNWVLLPEKINGKYCIMHSISPDILLDYLDDLEFENKNWIRSYYTHRKYETHRWDNQMRGVGPSPLLTDDGWLVLYHATDKRDPNRYKIGAMILDYQNPSHILYRSPNPILAPDAQYENDGYKPGVIYTCGAVIVDGILYVYYGGADTVVCVAYAELSEFLSELKHAHAPILISENNIRFRHI